MTQSHPDRTIDHHSGTASTEYPADSYHGTPGDQISRSRSQASGLELIEHGFLEALQVGREVERALLRDLNAERFPPQFVG